MNPNPRITSFETGNVKKQFPYTLQLNSKVHIQIRDNALESARLTANRFLERNLGTSSYFMKLRKYPHHILRENPIAAGAGADRFSTGMKKAFGKPIGLAARIREGHTIYEVSVNKNGLSVAKAALQRASKKLPCTTAIVVNENK